jgi:flagellar P-ring protein precursor FlgI
VEGAGASVQKNFPTVGRVVNGALIEKELSMPFNDKGYITFALNTPDFTTASRMAKVINQLYPNSLPAKTLDAGTVEVTVPDQFKGNTVGFVTAIERLEVIPDAISKVVINERTGTVIMGANVRISTVAISHGNLSLKITEDPNVSQPGAFSSGETVVTPNTGIEVAEEKPPIFLVEAGVSIADIVKALNAMGVSPRDLIAIFQALKSAGALQAKLEII